MDVFIVVTSTLVCACVNVLVCVFVFCLACVFGVCGSESVLVGCVLFLAVLCVLWIVLWSMFLFVVQ